jgi:hypothetical protein
VAGCSKTIDAVFKCIRGDRVDASKSDWMARGEACRDPDPMLQLIEDHQKSIRQRDEIVKRVSELERSLPKEKQESNFYGWQLTIVPTDDPQWIDITQRYYEEEERCDEIAAQMVSVSPTTLAGVAAILQYAADHVDAGYLWPDDLGELADCDDESMVSHRQDWLFFLNRNLAEAVRRLEA